MLGTVLVFKKGTTPEEARAAIEKIADVLSPDYFIGPGPDYKPVQCRLEEFDGRCGGPVWYIP